MSKRLAADASLVLPKSKAQAKYAIKREAEDDGTVPTLSTQAPPAAAKEEEVCQPYVGREVKVRGELLGAKGWKAATVSAVVKGII
jgi:hypothetical protein